MLIRFLIMHAVFDLKTHAASNVSEVTDSRASKLFSWTIAAWTIVEPKHALGGRKLLE